MGRAPPSTDPQEKARHRGRRSTPSATAIWRCECHGRQPCPRLRSAPVRSVLRHCPRAEDTEVLRQARAARLCLDVRLPPQAMPHRDDHSFRNSEPVHVKRQSKSAAAGSTRKRPAGNRSRMASGKPLRNTGTPTVTCGSPCTTDSRQPDVHAFSAASSIESRCTPAAFHSWMCALAAAAQHTRVMTASIGRTIRERSSSR